MSVADVAPVKQNRQQVYDSEPYHLEKYIVPGAAAVSLLFLLPWYLLGGSALGGVDLGTSVIAALVVGHFVESLKVYQWGSRVRGNYDRFQAKIDALLGEWGVQDDAKYSKRALAQASLFAVIEEGPGSEFTWNLVRWQKMTVIAALLRMAALMWGLYAALAALHHFGLNPFKGDFRLSVLRESLPLWATILGNLLLAVVHWVAAYYMYKFGLERQNRTNESYYQLIRRYRDQIEPSLRLGSGKKEGV